MIEKYNINYIVLINNQESNTFKEPPNKKNLNFPSLSHQDAKNIMEEEMDKLLVWLKNLDHELLSLETILYPR